MERLVFLSILLMWAGCGQDQQPRASFFSEVGEKVSLTSKNETGTSITQKNFAVSEEQIYILEARIQALEDKIQNLKKNYANSHSIPDSRILRRFNYDLDQMRDATSGQRGLKAWIEEILSGSVEEERLSLKVHGFEAAGLVDSADYGAALASLEEDCKRWDAISRELTDPDYFDYFDCGTPENVTQYPAIGYKQLKSVASVTLRLRPRDVVGEVPGPNISGTVDSKDHGEALRSWGNACFASLRAEKTRWGKRFLTASCGKPNNVTQYPAINHKKFSSRMSVFLKN